MATTEPTLLLTITHRADGACVVEFVGTEAGITFVSLTTFGENAEDIAKLAVAGAIRSNDLDDETIEVFADAGLAPHYWDAGIFADEIFACWE